MSAQGGKTSPVNEREFTPPPLDDTTTLGEVLAFLSNGGGWKPGTPEYKAFVQTAALIEQERLRRGATDA